MITTTKTTTFQYFQSANSSFKEIKQYFVVRIKEYEFIRSNLFDDQMAGSVQHFLILGRRGSGKSTLLKRLECEVNENESLKEKYISINLAEEQASIHRLFDLFEEIIKTLKYDYGFTILPDTDTLDIPEDYSEYSRELYFHIQSALQAHSKKLLLLIDNIDKIFLGIKEDAQVLREILLNYDDIKIIGGSTRMSEHFWQYDLPFYQFFSILRLEALRSEELKNFLVSWSQRLQIKELEDFVKTKPGQLEAIRILTDGMPRTLQFFVDLLINHPQQNGYAYIQKIMDMVTPLYQERLNNLLPIEQKIVLKLAFTWEAASIRDLVKPTKIESKLLSANLKKLSDNKIVDTIATGKKNHLYRLTERFFNMWLIVTQGNPMEKRKARWLTIFIENFYDQKAIKHHLISPKKGNDFAPFNLALIYHNRGKYELAEKFYLKAYDFGIKEAMDNLSYLCYIDLKDKDKLNLIFNKWKDDSSNKTQYQILSKLWNGELTDIQKEVFKLAKDKNGINEMFLMHLLVQYQKNLVWKLFNDPEIGGQLKIKFVPLYYATSQLIDNEESKMNLLKIPPEIEETVQDILNKIKKLRKEYYPEN